MTTMMMMMVVAKNDQASTPKRPVLLPA